MANIVRAISNTNWSATGTWQVWDGSSWQAYGQIPQAGDTVYLNAHHPTVNVNISLGNNGVITNEGNSELGITAHGYMVLTTSRTIVANLVAKDEYIFYRSASSYVSVSITGNISLDNATLFYSSTSNSIDISHNGSSFITNNARYIFETSSSTSSTNYTFTTNANVTLNLLDFTNVASAGNGRFTANGNVEITSDFTQSNFIYLRINGILKTNSFFYTGTRIDFLGGYVISNLTTNPLLVTTLTLSNPSSFKIEMLQLTDYPPENVVKQGVAYAWGQKVGTYQAPPEAVVLKDYVYDNGDKIGTLENQNIVGCVTKEDVREGVDLVGMYEDEQQVVGTLVVPSVDDVREGVIFDNGSVGTLIVQGGGDRLRIANFGYYTDSQSDTYIVDINESFKQMFATAEESVLLELFPELDLDNIPDKYFDDLFVKYLKYRLIVEYYRGAGINSVFAPSELTTEVVNYQNVRCEYWLNLANIYLNAWDKKYPNSVKKQRILL